MSLFGFFGGAQEEPDIAEEPAGESGLQCHHFFVNILLLNKDEVVRSTAEQKVAERLPRAKRLQKLAGRIANRKGRFPSAGTPGIPHCATFRTPPRASSARPRSRGAADSRTRGAADLPTCRRPDPRFRPSTLRPARSPPRQCPTR